MSKENPRRVDPKPASGEAKDGSRLAPPSKIEAAEDEEPISHLRRRVFQPIQARVYSRINRTVDRLGYVSAALLLVVVTGATALAFTFWNSPDKVWKDVATVRFYLAARSLSPPRYLGTQEMIRELDNQLTEGSAPSNRERTDLGYSAWTEGQIVLALQGRDILDPVDLAQWFHREAGVCHCWRAGPTDRENVAATAWVLLALARMQVRPSQEEIEFLLANQHRPGWWQFFPASGPLKSAAPEDPRNASTYATSFSILALQELLKRNLVPGPDEQRLRAAIAKGRNWLLSSTIPGKPGRWKDYPNGEDGHESIGISGIALHALHRTPGPLPLVNDADWMAQLPTEMPHAAEVAISGQPVHITADEFARDGTHMFAFPWLLVGTVDAYPQGNLIQRTQALRLLSDAPREQDGLRMEAQGKPWVAAEFLIALRYLRGDDVL